MEKAVNWKPIIDEYLYLLAIPVNMETHEEQRREGVLGTYVSGLYYKEDALSVSIARACGEANGLRAQRAASGWGRHDA
jgi:hypothetical protein